MCMRVDSSITLTFVGGCIRDWLGWGACLHRWSMSRLAALQKQPAFLLAIGKWCGNPCGDVLQLLALCTGKSVADRPHSLLWSARHALLPANASSPQMCRPICRIVSVGDFMSVFSSHSEVVELIRAASGPDNDAVSLTLLRKDVPRTTLVPASPEPGSESEMASCGPFGFEIDPPSEDLSSVEPSEMESPQARDGEAAVGGERSASSVGTSVTPVHTSSAQRRKWVSFLKTVNSTMVEPVWHVPDDTGKFAPGEHCAKFGTKPEYCLPVNDTTTALVAAGVPHNLRRQVWLRSCGAAAGSGRVALRYDEIALCAAEQLMGTETASQIEKDLLRTFPTNVYFSEMDREGTRRLRRVLTTAAWTLPDIGYCQGMGMIAAMLLLVLEEAEAYWAFRAVVVKLLPVDYFSSTLIGAMADQRVLADLIEVNENRVFKVMKTHGIELSLITMSWFLTAFCTIAPLHTTLRIWDFFLLEGSVVLFKVRVRFGARLPSSMVRHHADTQLTSCTRSSSSLLLLPPSQPSFS
jgi:hypothetical protein